MQKEEINTLIASGAGASVINKTHQSLSTCKNTIIDEKIKELLGR